MKTIGEVARQTRVSKRTLRHWDAIGLLSPAQVDPGTSYRWYAPSQVGRVHAIVGLQSLGFSLEQIAGLLDGEQSAASLIELLRARERELAAEIETASDNLGEVRRRLRSLQRGIEMSATSLQLHSLPDLTLHAVTTEVRDETEIGVALAELSASITDRLATSDGAAPRLIYIYRGIPGVDLLEVVVGVENSSDSSIAGPALDELTQVTVPAQPRAASIPHVAGAGGIGDAWLALDAALEPYGLTTTGSYRQLNPAGDHEPVILQAPVVPLGECLPG